MKRAPTKPSDSLSLLLFYAVTGEGGEMPWSDGAAEYLDLAEFSLGLVGKKLTRRTAFLCLDRAIDFAITEGR